MTRCNIPYQLVNYCEIDKYASKAYSLIHNVKEELNLGDITKVNENELLDFDLMTWGFPCQDISIAGKQKGIIQGETRSGLYYEGLRILKYKKPKYSIIENVKGLTQKRFKKQFEQILQDLNNIGYNNYWQVLNAKDYGVPQNRERVFIVSIRKEVIQEYKFPKSFECQKNLVDLLEKEIDFKYCHTTKGRLYMDREVKDGRTHWDFGHHHDTDIKYSKCITTNCYKSVPYNVLIDRRGCKFGLFDCDFIYDYDGFCKYCIDYCNFQMENYPSLGIRKLTPLECFRLMGFDDQDYYILKENKLSNTQLYKMSGNSIVVNVLEEIFKNLFLHIDS